VHGTANARVRTERRHDLRDKKYFGLGQYTDVTGVADWGGCDFAKTAQPSYACGNVSGGNLRWHTFLGGAGNDHGVLTALAPDGGVYLAGSSDVTWGSSLRAFAGKRDGFVAGWMRMVIFNGTFLG